MSLNGRLLLVVVWLIFSFQSLQGQCPNKPSYKAYFPYVQQTDPSLCWGACIEMILSYWQPDVAKCLECEQTYVNRTYVKRVKKSGVVHSGVSGLPTSMYYRSNFVEHRDNFAAILAYHGFHSIQMVNEYPIALTEELIEEEICNCRPMILIFDRGRSGTHVTVLKSYEKKVFNYLELDVYDPQSTNGLDIYIVNDTGTRPITWLKDKDTNNTIAEIKAFVYGIEESDRSNKGSACRSCTKLENNYKGVDSTKLASRTLPTSSVNLRRIVNNNRAVLPIDENYKLSTARFTDLVCSGAGYFYPVVGLSSEDFLNIREFDFTLSNDELPDVLEYVTTIEEESIVLTFYLSEENEYQLYKISARSEVDDVYNDEKVGVKLENRNVCRGATVETIPFTVVRVPDLRFTFYQYKYKNKIYLRPINEISQNGLNIGKDDRLYRKNHFKQLLQFVKNSITNPLNSAIKN